MLKSGSLISKDEQRDGNRLWSVTVQPNLEPVTVADVKSFARIDGSDEDELLEDFIKGVRQAAEDYTKRAFIKQTVLLTMDFWPDTVVNLPRPPLMSVDKIAIVNEDDEETEYSSSNYYVVTDGLPGRVVIKKGVTAPTNTTRYHSGFLIQYQAGYGTDPDDVPSAIRLALQQWVTVVYETRVIESKPPPQAKKNLDLFRVLRFG